MKNRLEIGRLFFGVAAIGAGLQQLIRQDFVRLVPPLPPWLKCPFFWADASGVVLVLVGLAIALDRIRRPSAQVLGALLVGAFILHLPGVAANPGAGYMWTNPCKALALFGGAILLAFDPTDLPAERTDLDGPVANCICF